MVIGGKMKAKVSWNEKMSFTGIAESDFEVPLDTYTAFGGENEGFRPMELMAISLAGCTAMDVLSIMKKKRQSLTSFEVKVDAERAEEHPKVFTQAEIQYLVTGHGIDEKALIRAIELSATRYCPAQGMLTKIMPILLSYQIFEEQEDGNKKLLVKGTWSEDQ